MRRFALVLLAGLLALGISAGVGKLTAKPVHAANVCEQTDPVDQVILNTYNSTSTWVTGADGLPHQLNLDLATYRLVENGWCYMGGYVSEWFTNHNDRGHLDPQIRMESYNPTTSTYNGPWQFDRGTYWDWGNFVWTQEGPTVSCTSCWYYGPWTSYTKSVTLPNGQLQPMGFGIVACGTTSCGYFADTAITTATDCPEYCAFNVASTVGYSWYLWRSG